MKTPNENTPATVGTFTARIYADAEAIDPTEKLRIENKTRQEAEKEAAEYVGAEYPGGEYQLEQEPTP